MCSPDATIDGYQFLDFKFGQQLLTERHWYLQMLKQYMAKEERRREEFLKSEGISEDDIKNGKMHDGKLCKPVLLVRSPVYLDGTPEDYLIRWDPVEENELQDSGLEK